MTNPSTQPCDLYKQANDSNCINRIVESLSTPANFSIYKNALVRHAVARKCYFNYPKGTDGNYKSHDFRNLTNSDLCNRARPKQEEKNIAKVICNLWNQNQHKIFGRVVDFEVPLTLPKADAASDSTRTPDDQPFDASKYKPKEAPYPRGKIDLLSVKGDTLFILELKRKKSQETYLRCLLEAYTYLKTIKRPKEFTKEAFDHFDLPTPIRKIGICPLIFESDSCEPYNQYKNRSQEILAIENTIQDDESCGSLLVYAFTPQEQEEIEKKYEEMIDEARKRYGS